MYYVTVLPGQTIFDIVIQEKGSLDGLFTVLDSNNMSIGDTLNAGTKLKIEGDPNDRQMYKYLTKKNIKPATASVAAESDIDPGFSGIGYWIIEDDFVVS